MAAIAIVAGLGWSATATAQTEFKLTASDAAADDQFGWSVSISGEYAIVGTRFDGAAYIIFERAIPGASSLNLRHQMPPQTTNLAFRCL